MPKSRITRSAKRTDVDVTQEREPLEPQSSITTRSATKRDVNVSQEGERPVVPKSRITTRSAKRRVVVVTQEGEQLVSKSITTRPGAGAKRKRGISTSQERESKRRRIVSTSPRSSDCQPAKCCAQCIETMNSKERSKYFAKLQDEMKQCRNFEELEALAIVREEEIERVYPLTAIEKQTVYDVINSKDQIDDYASKILPFDVPGHPQLVAASVYGDGNCFSRCGSILAYNCQHHFQELRCRITVKLCVNKDFYTSANYLSLGHEARNDYMERYATYSADDKFNGVHVKGKDYIAQAIYKNHVYSFRKSGVYACIFSFYALADALKTNLFSIYPMYGFNVRNDLHRFVPTRVPSKSLGYIMWTNIHEEANPLWWKPDHFVVGLDLNQRRDRYVQL